MLGEQHKRGGYVEQMEGNQVHTHLSQVCLGLDMIEELIFLLAGREGEAREVTNVPPQGSLISLRSTSRRSM